MLNLIASNETTLIELQKNLDAIEVSTKPNLNDKLDRLVNIDLKAQKDEIISHTLPQLQSELDRSEVNELGKLEDSKKVLELALKPYRYSSTKIVSNIITYEHPVKPKNSS